MSGERRVIDLSEAVGACGDLSVVLEAIIERVSPGDVIVFRVSKELAHELKEAVELLSDRVEVLSESESSEGKLELELRIRG